MFGHGFIPRVTDRNRAGVQRALSPGDLFGGNPPDVPCVILEGPAVHRDPTLASGLRSPGRVRIVDTESWRFGFPSTWGSTKWSNMPYTPATPFEPTAAWIHAFVRSDLLFQASAGAEAYLLPAWLRRGSDVRPQLRGVFEAAEALVGREVDARPLIATLPAARTSLDEAYDAIEELHGAVSAVYALINNWAPMTDPVDSLAGIVSMLLEVEQSGRPVIAGRGGAIAPVLTALGVSAADAGLGDAEQFNAASAVRRPTTTQGQGPERAPRFGPRIYIPAIGRSLSGKQFQALTGLPRALAAVSCQERCCRMHGSMGLAQGRAAEHSLTSRVAEVLAVDGSTRDIRADRAMDLVLARTERLRRVNAALRDASLPLLRDDHLANQRALLGRFTRLDGAA